MLRGRGMGSAVADEIAPAQDDAMRTAILALYRAAAQPVMAGLGRDLPAAAARPGLVVLATDDHNVGTPEQRREAAELAGASVAVLPGLGHWWLTQDPAAGAAAVSRFWASVDRAGSARPATPTAAG